MKPWFAAVVLLAGCAPSVPSVGAAQQSCKTADDCTLERPACQRCCAVIPINKASAPAYEKQRADAESACTVPPCNVQCTQNHADCQNGNCVVVAGPSGP